jgi:hypothetical protein
MVQKLRKLSAAFRTFSNLLDEPWLDAWDWNRSTMVNVGARQKRCASAAKLEYTGV